MGSNPRYRILFLTLSLLAGSTLAQGPGGGPPPLGLPPVPPQNPITEAKRVLGKILFWEEQLSSDDSTACGTCHRPENGGVDPRFAVNPGLNGIFGTPDDAFGSLGMIHTDAAGNYSPNATFGLFQQVTPRRAPDFFGGLFSPTNFWDGRAGPSFTDPQTGVVLIPLGGALEAQAVGPILSNVEMGHDGRDWNQVAARLAAAIPMRLATNVPADMSAAIAANPGYPALFQAAFGTPQITAARIAFAIATYERTLVPNQTPWDAFAAGNPAALTAAEVNGLNNFLGVGRCGACHVPPLFSDNTFRNIGLRPIAEDNGRQAVTGNFADRGRFKVPSLRNVALRTRFFHNGQHNNLTNAVEEYDNSGGPFPDNRDPVLGGLVFSPAQRNSIVTFLGALTDPRVAAGIFPFDRPTLYSETVPPGSNRFGNETAGSAGIEPQIIALTPIALGMNDARLAVAVGLGGAPAAFVWSAVPSAPQDILGIEVLVDLPTALVQTTTLDGIGAGGGFKTLRAAVPNLPVLSGLQFFGQWFIVDPGAANGVSASQAATWTLF